MRTLFYSRCLEPWPLLAARRPRPRTSSPSTPMRASPSEWGPGPPVKKAFEAECGCDVEFVSVADGVALLNRVKLEGASTKADIVLGLDTNLTAEAKATGLFAPARRRPCRTSTCPAAGPTTSSCPTTTAISPSSTTPRS